MISTRVICRHTSWRPSRTTKLNQLSCISLGTYSLQTQLSGHCLPFRRHEASGADDIFLALLQQEVNLLVLHVARLMRDSLPLAYIAKVVRKDYSLTKYFRLISLTSFMLKGIEKIMDNKIRSKALKDFFGKKRELENIGRI